MPPLGVSVAGFTPLKGVSYSYSLHVNESFSLGESLVSPSWRSSVLVSRRSLNLLLLLASLVNRADIEL